MSILQTIHGEVRWILAIVAVIAIVKFAMGWLQKAEYKPMDRGLMSGFTGLVDLNVTLGLILFVGLGITQGVWPAFRWEHMVTMILAAAVAHSSAAWRKSEDSATKFRNNLFVVLGALLLIFVGVMRLRGGWVW